MPRERAKISVILPKEQQSNYYVPSADSKGHSARVQFRVPPEFFRLIEEIMVKRDRFGWKTQSDFFRWSLWRSIEEALKDCEDEEMSSLFAILNTGVRTRQIEYDMSQYQEFLDTVGKSVSVLEAAGADSKAQEELRRALRTIEAIPDGSWREIWKKKFEQYLGLKLKK